MLQACGSSGKVVGFEPNPVCLEALKRWPQWDANLVVHAVAVSDHEGLAHLLSDDSMQISTLHHEIQARAGLSPTRSFPVRVATLDSFLLPSCDLMKIDVDGEELRCLRGGQSTIARLRPPIVVEVSWEFFSPREIAELDSWLRSISYEIRNLFDGQVLAGSRRDHWMVALWPHERDARPFIDAVRTSGRSFLYEHPHWNHYAKFTTDSSA